MNDSDAPGIPSSWEDFSLQEVSGRVMVVGASDSGKTTLVRYCRTNWDSSRGPLGILDGDPGQSRLAPPTTLTARIEGEVSHSWFVGSVSPRGHMLPHLTGCRRLVEAVDRNNPELVLHDTTGFVDRESGGIALKLNMIDLLEPSAVVVLQRGNELNELIEILSHSVNVKLYQLEALPGASSRSQEHRSAYRRRAFEVYFEGAGVRELDVTVREVRPRTRFEERRLVAFSDREGYLIGLGIVVDPEPGASTVRFKTPVSSPESVPQVRIGDLYLNPDTYRHEPAPSL